MLEKLVCAGFGGQGVMSMGRLVAQAAMGKGLEVSWLPSYGPEMRGGTANCHVIVSSAPIGSPVISLDAGTVIAMNLPSMKRFESELVSGGLLIYNSSLIDEEPQRTDIRSIAIAGNEIAARVGSLKTANMVMLGAYTALVEIISVSDLVTGLRHMFGASKEHFVPLNEQALQQGFSAAQSGPPQADAEQQSREKSNSKAK